MKKTKIHKKMSAEDLQGLLHMRRRSWIKKNGKAYSRKIKHKKGGN